jgi:coenzyme F420-0:L-glutamate ligase/coenzyme F420-1:gamma-L-glutamate ligase
MRDIAGPVSRGIASRRSVRRFADRAVDTRLVDDLVRLACAAPAPHHSRPWRFVHIASPETRERLADAMSDAWRADLEVAERPVKEIARMLERSREQISQAPVLLLACLLTDGARKWPDKTRKQAERDMFVQSLGAALQNILLAAAERGLAGYLKGAPLFCPEAVSEALRLPAGWEPTFLVLLGHPDRGFEPAPRPAIDPAEFMVER